MYVLLNIAIRHPLPSPGGISGYATDLERLCFLYITIMKLSRLYKGDGSLRSLHLRRFRPMLSRLTLRSKDSCISFSQNIFLSRKVTVPSGDRTHTRYDKYSMGPTTLQQRQSVVKPDEKFIRSNKIIVELFKRIFDS